MYFTGGFEDVASGIEPSLSHTILMGVASLAIFSLLNGKLLAGNGQTTGKKVLGIKIVDMNGNIPSVKEHLVVRYIAYFVPGWLPVVGSILPLVNVLFIFGKQRRCLHDYIAKTKVVVS